MRRLFLAFSFLLFSLCAHAGRYHGRIYYITPTGVDTNNGTTVGTAWLTPNHALNCGDIIFASSGTYSSANFGSGSWGTVTCPNSNGVAWLVCTTFDACKISATGSSFGMYVDHSYWGVQGWEVTVASTGYTCFAAAPPSSGATAGIHHIIFANDIANGCGGGGISSFNVGSYSVDYFFAVGDIAYNAAQNSLNCYSGFSAFQPIASDANSGNHIFFGGDFAWGNTSPASCPYGAAATGFIFDTFDWKGVSGSTLYTEPAAMEDDMAIGNGGFGIQAQNYVKNPSSHNTVLLKNNTTWGNSNSTVEASSALCNEISINIWYGVTETANLAQSIYTTKCPSTNWMYAAQAYDTSTASGSSIAGNWLFAAAGSTSGCSASNDDSNTFTCGSNITNTDPGFTSPSVPGSPACGSATSVAGCMGPIVSTFTPTASGSTSYGYQTPSLVNGTDQANYPKLLCQTGLPVGLFTPSCN